MIHYHLSEETTPNCYHSVYPDNLFGEYWFCFNKTLQHFEEVVAMEAESLHNPGEGEFGVSCTNSPKGSVPYKSPKMGVQIEKK